MKSECLQGKFILYLVIVMSNFYSCGGGNEGTIRGYTFTNLNKNKLDYYLNQIYSVNQNYIDTHYHYRAKDYKYCKIKYQESFIILEYRIYDSLSYHTCNKYPKYQKEGSYLKLSLKTAGRDGEGLEFEKDIPRNDKRLFEKIFRDSFIEKILVKLPKEVEMCEGY